MKWMIASDLHGSAYWTRKLIERWEAERPERVLLLGDLLYHGPRNDLPEEYDPRQVIALLNRLQPLCVRGNCDAEVDQMVLTFPIMADYGILATQERTVCFTHGHLHHPENPLPMKKGDVLLCGHFHVPACQKQPDGWWYLNPGSVSIPKDGSEHQYLTPENDCWIWKRMDGTVIRQEKLS